MASSREGQRRARRSRRKRRQAYMHPPEATQISTRTREKGWIKTKSITRFHRRAKYWEDYAKWWRGEW